MPGNCRTLTAGACAVPPTSAANVVVSLLLGWITLKHQVCHGYFNYVLGVKYASDLTKFRCFT